MGGWTDGAGEQLFARSLARSSLIFEAGAAQVRKLPSCPSLPLPISCLEAASERIARLLALYVTLMCPTSPRQYHLLPHISMLFRHEGRIP